jgi:hypothetical protein
VGNAVVVPKIEAVAKAMIEAMNKKPIDPRKSEKVINQKEIFTTV